MILRRVGEQVAMVCRKARNCPMFTTGIFTNGKVNNVAADAETRRIGDRCYHHPCLESLQGCVDEAAPALGLEADTAQAP